MGWITVAYPGISGAMAAAFAGAAGGFVSGAVSTSLQGGDFGDVLESAFWGAVSGFVTGYTVAKGLEVLDNFANPNTSAQLLEVGADGKIVGAVTKNGEIVGGAAVDPSKVNSGNLFYNGINTTPAGAVQRGIERIGPGKGFYIMYNPTNGTVADLIECSLDKIAGQSQISRSAADILSKMDVSKMSFYAHSQGGIVLRNSLTLAKAGGLNLSGATASFSGAAVNEYSTRILLGSYGVNVAKFSAHPFDLVAAGAGYNALTPPNPYRMIGSILAAPFLATPMDYGLSPHTTHVGGWRLAPFPWYFSPP